MREWIWITILSSIIALSILSYPMTTYAESDEDLLEVYGKSSGSVDRTDIANQIYNTEAVIESIERVAELNEIYNQIADNYNNHQREVYTKVQSTVEKYADSNKEIISKVETDLETISIEDLRKIDSEYKANIVRMNELVSSMNDIHLSTDYRKTDYNLSELYNNIDKLTVEYESAIESTEIGNVNNIEWIMDVDYYVTSNYGYRVDPITGTDITFHSGADFRCPIGTEVRALFDGKVIDVGYSKSSGNYVTVQSSDKIKYFICHLEKSLVSKGDYVKQYDVIALSGASGARCTGPHLHLALFINGATYDVTKLF